MGYIVTCESLMMCYFAIGWFEVKIFHRNSDFQYKNEKQNWNVLVLAKALQNQNGNKGNQYLFVIYIYCIPKFVNHRYLYLLYTEIC